MNFEQKQQAFLQHVDEQRSFKAAGKSKSRFQIFENIIRKIEFPMFSTRKYESENEPLLGLR